MFNFHSSQSADSPGRFIWQSIRAMFLHIIYHSEFQPSKVYWQGNLLRTFIYLVCAIATSSTSLKMIGSTANLNYIIYLYFHVLWARASQMLPKVPHSLQKVCKESPCSRGCISFRHCIEDEFCYIAFLTWFLMLTQTFVNKTYKSLLEIF